MSKWKLFESERFGQILVSKSESEEGDPKLEFSVEVEGFDVISIGPVFKGSSGEQVRDKLFDGVTLLVAESAAEEILSEIEEQELI